ncbi:MAG: aminomethyl-transferring glycine dehydrogenase [Gemmatimonadetes bacterium]|nr:aminomethyl-transferring glycine dehydrogenase [Gemmatimonadota bacterium]MBT5056674.1 aminomethyl-transferring glycine dehydrogenase [Gemmatimonadota bacterium]MBT5141899.1 aminomethyl-transferring glycine dehydrogenase [Gemmatimonadota bacterium]MBT5589811.1 aminomethyl-transferring glycine dehydrogenase [Gemmatimonadota bacterium]MBT5964012.1 aminomethyl-transferring glycine dehydrogenase [Gemmatimonadota bacterium]
MVSVEFARRHIGPSQPQIDGMLKELGFESLDALTADAVPAAILDDESFEMEPAWSEHQLLSNLRRIGRRNQDARSYIGMGYHDCITPPVIQRNILENPAWYTQYTPYQSEIAQGRLEALLNFQTVIIDLTGLPLANASLLDEATAAAEAMAMLQAAQGRRGTADRFFVAADVHPQTLAVVETRARWRGWKLVVEPAADFDASLEKYAGEIFGALFQYPATDGAIDVAATRQRIAAADAAQVPVVVAADPLALTLLPPPGELGAAIAIGSTQRFGMPMGFGGPHAAYLAASSDFKRLLPGRIIGVTRDIDGRPALRMALQTREQHIRREKATSNICTAQVLPAVVASMYAVYHGPEGLRAIAAAVHEHACQLAATAEANGLQLVHDMFFDTIALKGDPDVVAAVHSRAKAANINLRSIDPDIFCISLDEATTADDLTQLADVLGGSEGRESVASRLVAGSLRESDFMQHPVFERYRSETEMLRYMRRLDHRDLSLTTSMIPLGSCTMKLNATAEMMPITWPEFARPHPFAPMSQNDGYAEIFEDLEKQLSKLTGLGGVSLQPNAGSQGEYAGLLVIHRYHEDRGDHDRRVCLIPTSAHGTNPASAVMAGLEVALVACDDHGNIDLEDLRDKAEKHSAQLAALMVTYPSTHGVFEEGIRDICDVIHAQGGLVYMDGANMNAMVGLCRPGEFGVDVCHLNLHKTFCIPHGGGGPGMGPIAVADHLTRYLPAHPLDKSDPARVGAVAAAPYSSAVILLISWAYLKMMGGEGLRRATQVAILNANYVAHRLHKAYPVLYRGKSGLVAHEAICDLRGFKHVEVDDVAKRLMDYGFHAPTVHFPVPGTIMIEPTESEARQELDRFCDALLSIRKEIADIEDGHCDSQDNLLRNAPHTIAHVLSQEWTHSYSRESATRPGAWQQEHKFWPSVGRIDNAFGDRQLVCACPPIEDYLPVT